MLERFWL